MFSNFYTFVLSLILLPVCYGIGKSLLEMILTLNTFSNIQSLWTYFLCGFITYIVLQIILFRPLRIYVFGHELTHALAGFISGARLKSFKIKKSTGNVTLSKVNIFIALAPYFVPIYALLLILLYAIFNMFDKKSYNIHQYFLFLFGMSIAFHIVLTIFAIKQGQSDLEKYGIVYSLLLVFVANCVVLSLIFSMFFSVSFVDFLFDSIKNIHNTFLWIFLSIRKLTLLPKARMSP